MADYIAYIHGCRPNFTTSVIGLSPVLFAVFYLHFGDMVKNCGGNRGAAGLLCGTFILRSRNRFINAKYYKFHGQLVEIKFCLCTFTIKLLRNGLAILSHHG